MLVLGGATGVAVLAGCGGGKSSSNNQQTGITRVRARMTVNWAEKTRGVVGGPASALSGRLIFKGAGPNGEDLIYTLDRPAGAGAVNQDLETPFDLESGKRYEIVFQFFAQPSAQQAAENLVALISAFVPLDASGVLKTEEATTGDGQPVAFSTQLAYDQLILAPSQRVRVGESVDLVYVAHNTSTGAYVALPLGAGSYNIVSGGEFLRVENGQAIGVAPGVAEVTVTVDGKTSEPVPIQVFASISGAFGITRVDGIEQGYYSYYGSTGYGYNALRLNDNGVIVGSQINRDAAGATVNERAAQWQAGIVTPLGVLPGGDNSGATDINGSGQIVGTSEILITGSLPDETYDDYTVPRAFLFQNGQMNDLGVLPSPDSTSGYERSYGVGISENGLVVGSSYYSNNAGNDYGERAFLWQNGQFTNIGTPRSLPYGYSLAQDVNNSGMVIGVSYEDDPNNPDDDYYGAFVWQNGAFTDLSTLFGAPGDYDFTFAADLNENGQVIGSSYDENGQDLNGDGFPDYDFRAFVWQNGQVTVLPDLNLSEYYFYDYAFAYSINNNGEIVGESGGVAVMWINNQIIDLNDTINADSGLYLARALRINNNRQILCEAYDTVTSAYYLVLLNYDPNGTVTRQKRASFALTTKSLKAGLRSRKIEAPHVAFSKAAKTRAQKAQQAARSHAQKVK